MIEMVFIQFHGLGKAFKFNFIGWI